MFASSSSDSRKSTLKTQAFTGEPEVLGYYLKSKLKNYVLPILLATAVSVYGSMKWLQHFAYHISVPLVLTISLVSVLAAFVLLSLITSGVVQTVCRRKITEVLK